ncbi:uncharacterized protein PV09_02329 [Verruconis gallopava]|uniref:Sas10 C-terminal domain-containing protein n=1 Tax=Verruconis gallopava TaxID=253628 RepID=A0A0D2AJ88_9PEZI|nr:uncharacterized protein PV09_02329 [Verruconis gallopava]KIW06615.1 hypothetical protein PV09_02329 [Verruconis gallopava]
MGKKRKASSQAYNNPDRPTKPESSKLLINSYEDVADSEDEFLDNRDRILLDEGPLAKKQRKLQEEDELLDLSDEEVLALPESEDEDYYEDDDEDREGEQDNIEENQPEQESEDGINIVSGGVKVKSGKHGQDLEEEDDDEGWGDSKQDYYGADEIDTEQAALDEEAEAKRIQQKRLESLAGADMLFSLGGASAPEDDAESSDDEDEIVTEQLPELEIPENLGDEERLKLLKTRYPELEAIANDWLQLHRLRDEIERDASYVPKILELRSALNLSEGAESHIATIRYTALSAYLAACAMYFAVLTSTANGTSGVLALAPRTLREHPVIQNVLESRQMWEEVCRHPRVDTAAELADLEEQAANAAKGAQRTDLAASTAAEERRDESVAKPKVKKSKTAKAKEDLEAEALRAASEARRAERMRQVEEGLADLSELAVKRSSQKASKIRTAPSGKLIIVDDDSSDLGDESTLTAQELAAKAARKKSLKFYTSQIVQKANKQGSRSKDYGGDIDVPYRERLKDREARLNAAAERRGRQAPKPGEELGGESSGEETAANGKKQVPSDEEDYYDMVAARAKQKKADKKAAAEAYAEAQRQNAQVYEVEEVGPDGKRKISYQIEKNKGLTPHRKKEVRNPRVKKKLKYASKLKKLGSTRQVYKGGEGRGGYGGELSGIKTGLVKSIKL